MSNLAETRNLVDYEAIKAGRDDYIQFCTFVLKNYDRYDLTPDIYGDLRPRLKSLLSHLQS